MTIPQIPHAVATNLAGAKLALSINATQQYLSVETGQGARFPETVGGNWFRIVLYDGTNYECCKVTLRQGDTFTVLRGQEGTTAHAYASGAWVSHRFTGETLADLFAYLDTLSTQLVDNEMQEHMDDIHASRDAAQQSAAQAAGSAAQAAGSAADALASENAAAQSATDALASENAAAQSATDALASKNAAAQSATDAAQSKADAEAAKNAAVTASERAFEFADAADDARSQAGNAAQLASEARTQAEASADTAETAATQAVAAAGAAHLSQDAAAQSASQAQAAAQSATSASAAAFESETNAETAQAASEAARDETLAALVVARNLKFLGQYDPAVAYVKGNAVVYTVTRTIDGEDVTVTYPFAALGDTTGNAPVIDSNGAPQASQYWEVLLDPPVSGGGLVFATQADVNAGAADHKPLSPSTFAHSEQLNGVPITNFAGTALNDILTTHGVKRIPVTVAANTPNAPSTTEFYGVIEQDAHDEIWVTLTAKSYDSASGAWTPGRTFYGSIGAAASSLISNWVDPIAAHDASNTAHPDIRQAISAASTSGTPHVPSYFFVLYSGAAPAPTAAGQNYYDIATGKAYDAVAQGGTLAWVERGTDTVEVNTYLRATSKIWGLSVDTENHGGRVYHDSETTWTPEPNVYYAPDNATLGARDTDGALQVKDGGIVAAKIADAAVSSAKISSSAVTKAKLDASVFATQAEVNTGTEAAEAMSPATFSGAAKWGTKVSRSTATTGKLAYTRMAGVEGITDISGLPPAPVAGTITARVPVLNAAGDTIVWSDLNPPAQPAPNEMDMNDAPVQSQLLFRSSSYSDTSGLVESKHFPPTTAVLPYVWLVETRGLVGGLTQVAKGVYNTNATELWMRVNTGGSWRAWVICGGGVFNRRVLNAASTVGVSMTLAADNQTSLFEGLRNADWPPVGVTGSDFLVWMVETYKNANGTRKVQTARGGSALNAGHVWVRYLVTSSTWSRWYNQKPIERVEAERSYAVESYGLPGRTNNTLGSTYAIAQEGVLAQEARALLSMWNRGTQYLYGALHVVFVDADTETELAKQSVSIALPQSIRVPVYFTCRAAPFTGNVKVNLVLWNDSTASAEVGFSLTLNIVTTRDNI